MSDGSATRRERTFVVLQACLPTRGLSRLVHSLAHWRAGALKNAFIRLFIRRFGVDMGDAEHSEPAAYPHFNAFFTRALRPGARPLAGDDHTVVSPVDGTLSQIGQLDDDRLLQAKGIDYSAETLLGESAEAFRGGSFCTIYLAPYNYHRIHAPTALRLLGHRHVPGRLFSVNPATARARPGLFVRNERVVAFFEAPGGGRLAMVMVGALLVGSVDTVWAGRICPPHRHRPSAFVSADGRFARGAEIGRFNMGSTVILLATRDVLTWEPQLTGGQGLHLGAGIGKLKVET